VCREAEVGLLRRPGMEWNPKPSFLSFVNVDRAVTIASGEMYPELGILQRPRSTRSLVDKSSFPTVGNEIPTKQSDRNDGVDPTMNESGRTGASSGSLNDQILSFVRASNGFFIAANFFNSGSGILHMLILHTRLRCSSAALTLAVACTGCGRPLRNMKSMTIGSAGQTFRAICIGSSGVKRICRFSRRGEANTRYRHRWHTCTSVCHASIWRSSSRP
jgi:hypothetical protein